MIHAINQAHATASEDLLDLVFIEDHISDLPDGGNGLGILVAHCSAISGSPQNEGRATVVARHTRTSRGHSGPDGRL